MDAIIHQTDTGYFKIHNNDNFKTFDCILSCLQFLIDKDYKSVTLCHRNESINYDCIQYAFNHYQNLNDDDLI